LGARKSPDKFVATALFATRCSIRRKSAASALCADSRAFWVQAAASGVVTAALMAQASR